MSGKTSLKKKLLILSSIFIYLVAIISMLNIIGWTFDIETFKRLTNLSVAMNPLSAMLFFLGCIALKLVQQKGYNKTRKYISAGIAGVLVIVGFYKFISLVFGIPFLLDQLIYFRDLFEPQVRENSQLDPVFVFSIIHIGLAIFLIDRNIKLVEFFLFLNTLIGLLCLYGYAYGVDYLKGVAQLFPVPILTAFCILFFNLAALFARPNRGSMDQIIGESPFEVVTMRLAALFLPLIVGWLKIYGVSNDWYTKEFGTAIFGVFSYSMSMFFLKRQSKVSYRLRKLRKRKNKTIKKNARKLEAIINNIPSEISILDNTGKFEKVNSLFKSHYNLKSEEVEGKKPGDILKNEDIVENFNKRLQVLERGAPQRHEFELKKEQKTLTFLNQTFPLRDLDENIYGLCSISTDITELKEKEREVKEQKIWLDKILSNLSEGIIVANNKGEFLKFNQVAKQILGKGSQETNREDIPETYRFYKLNGETLYPSEDLPLSRALKGEKVDNEEFLVKNPDWSQAKRISVSARPLDVNSQNDQAVMVFRDVTAMRNLLQEKKESAKKLKTILLSIEEGIIVLGEKGQPLIVNKKAKKLFGEIPENLEWKDISEKYNIYKEDGESMYHYSDLPIYKALKNEETVEDIVLLKRKNKKNKTLKVVANPITFADDSKNVVTILTDLKKSEYPDADLLENK